MTVVTAVAGRLILTAPSHSPQRLVITTTALSQRRTWIQHSPLDAPGWSPHPPTTGARELHPRSLLRQRAMTAAAAALPAFRPWPRLSWPSGSSDAGGPSARALMVTCG